MPSSPSVPHRLLALLGAVAVIAGAVGPASAAEPQRLRVRDAGRAWDGRDVAGEPSTARWIVRFRGGTDRRARDAAVRDRGLTTVRHLGRGATSVVRLPEGTDPTALQRLAGDAAVLSVTPDLRSTRFVEPTDPGYAQGLLWGLENTGQAINGYAGAGDVDVDAPAAWSVTTGDPALVVAVIDDGVDFSHPDLAGRAWTNPGESGDGRETNGIDDDGNGYVDDVHGWDFCHDDNTVHDVDDDFHGTHVAGTIAASLDGQGIVGVAPGIRIMALKFLDNAHQCGYDSMAIEAIEYAKSFGVRISNNSWGRRGGTTLQNKPLYDAIKGSGMLFVAAAGNAAIDNDSDAAPAYPASFDLPNIVSVAAVDNEGYLAAFSNHGRTRVDVLAPGVDILSALPADAAYPEPGWGWLDGTSMAAPHVTGVAALAASADPALAAAGATTALRDRVLATGRTLPQAAGSTATDRIVRASGAVDLVAPSALATDRFSFVTDSIIGSTARVTVRWPAAVDALSGTASYALGQSKSGGAWTTVTSSTGSRSATRTLAIGARYRYRVLARDRAGNASGWVTGPEVTARLYSEGSSLVRYGGTWRTSYSSSASGGRTRYATAAGAWVQFSFNGRSVAVIAPRSRTRGSVKVYVDGAYVKTVSTYRSTSQARVLVFAADWPTSGPHTIKLVVAGTAGRPRFDIDGFALVR